MSGPQPILDALLSRRSLRYGFKPQPVARQDLESIAACGLAAPSSKNAQPWRLHVVTDRALLDQLARLVSGARGGDSYVPRDPRTSEPYPRYTSTVLDSATVLLDVPATIWVENIGTFSGGREIVLRSSPEAIAATWDGYGFEMIGIGAAVENMWIAANALGLAAVFMGDVLIAAEAIREVLDLRGDLSGVLAMGYSSAEPRPPMDPRSAADLHRLIWH